MNLHNVPVTGLDLLFEYLHHVFPRDWVWRYDTATDEIKYTTDPGDFEHTLQEDERRMYTTESIAWEARGRAAA
jgi:hypothetical protein